MARTKQTTRKSTGGKVPVNKDMYVHARKQHLESMGNISIRAAFLLESAAAVAHKDETVLYKYATARDTEELITYLKSIQQTLDEVIDHVTKIAVVAAPVVTERRKRIYFPGTSTNDTNPGPTKRPRVD